MLEGLRRDSRERVKLWAMTPEAINGLIAEIENDRDLITCHNPKCGCSMYVRAMDTETIITHFARYPKTGSENYHPGKGESLEHQLAKQRLAVWLQQSYPSAEITTEYAIDDQRIDVYVRHSDGKEEAHEIQRTPQTTYKTQSRTAGYNNKGIDEVVWWWLDRGNEERSREWCINNVKQYGTAVSSYEEIMGHKILMDVRFTRHVSENILSGRRRENEARSAQLQQWADERDAKIKSRQARYTTGAQVSDETTTEAIGQTFPTKFPGGLMTVTAYDKATDRYTGRSGLRWQLVGGVMVTPVEVEVE